jgi:hypothetical protein
VGYNSWQFRWWDPNANTWNDADPNINTWYYADAWNDANARYYPNTNSDCDTNPISNGDCDGNACSGRRV